MSKFRLIFVVLFALFFASSAYAADIRLSSRCTLADAIIAANSDRAEGNCPAGRGADTIILSQDITLRAELPAITSKITIEGNSYTISGNNRYRIFYNDGGALTINNLTMINGYVEGDLITNADDTLKATTAQPFGGAIVNWEGMVTVSNSNFSGNSAEFGGAIINWEELSISDSSFSDNSAEYGGVIFNEGELSVSDSDFSRNSAEYSGAIRNWEELSISDSTFSGNSAEYGGAITNNGELSIVNSAFGNNSAEQGGAVYNWGELSISDSSFSDNSAEDGGGVIANGRNGELSIVNSSFSDNSAEDGGAIYNWEELSIVNSSFSHNSAEYGSAIFNDGELSISDSTFRHNSAESGGAIANDKDGTLSISDSTFSRNSAEDRGGAIINNGELSISSSTFSNNVVFDSRGGAIDNWGELSMVNSIIAGRGSACYSNSRLRRNINNFIQDGSCNPAFRGNPRLGTLVVPEDGSPAYFPLLANSRAIDAADARYCPETDQIGTKRPQGAGCDIGAIEYTAP